jgi:branched-chain amino acid transport system substrate-binding protein
VITRRSIVLLVGLCLALPACGTRRSSQALRSAWRGGASVTHNAAGTDGADATSAAGAASETGDIASTTAGGDAASGGGTTSGAAGSGSTAGSTTGSAGSESSGGSASAGAAALTKAPVRIGTIGSLSGPAGASLKPQADGVRIWVRWINDHGGLNGHPVEHLVADDGGDPSRHRSLVQEFVEQRKVIAFVGNPEALTGQGSVDYLTKAGIPVVGSEGAGQWFYESPSYFPQGSTGNALLQAGAYLAAVLNKSQGRTKVGLINCVEVQVCRDATNKAPAVFKKYGMDVVYSAQASLAQPDFTAECLNARQRGVQVMSIGMDANAIRTIAQACARQGFHPILGWTAGSTVAAHAHDPNLEGSQIASFVQGWATRNTPGTREFQDAMAKYAPGLEVGGGHMLGWVSGKVLEAGAKNLPAIATPKALLQGLWALHGDVLPDLTGPLLYNPGKPATPTVCNYAVTITAGKFVPAYNSQRACTAYDYKM